MACVDLFSFLPSPHHPATVTFRLRSSLSARRVLSSLPSTPRYLLSLPTLTTPTCPGLAPRERMAVWVSSTSLWLPIPPRPSLLLMACSSPTRTTRCLELLSEACSSSVSAHFHCMYCMASNDYILICCFQFVMLRRPHWQDPHDADQRRPGRSLCRGDSSLVKGLPVRRQPRR